MDNNLFRFFVQVTATAGLLLMKKITTNKNLIAQEYGMDLHLVDMSPDLPMLLMNLPKLQWPSKKQIMSHFPGVPICP
jgi:hypothetical protein